MDLTNKTAQIIRSNGSVESATITGLDTFGLVPGNNSIAWATAAGFINVEFTEKQGALIPIRTL